jgi:DNA-binding response OmpR family regulator
VRVLVVEDEQVLADAVATGLRRDSMAVDVVYDGDAALERIDVNDYDVIVLDRDLPLVHGDDVCRHIVSSGLSTRVLMLTAAGDVADRVEGLTLGADDYLAKPFHLRELAARLRAILRRFHRGDNEQRLRVGALLLDRDRLSLELDNAPVKLTSAEFMVLEALMRDPGKLLSRAALTELALGRPLEPYDRSVDTHVSNLRRKLGSGGSALVEIRSVRGKGYLLRVEARSA